jgi:hypothetical protein
MLPAGHEQTRRSAVPLTSEQRRARAQLAAHRRHHGDGAELPDQAAQLERATLDRHIDELVARASRMTPEQADRLRRLFAYGPPPTAGG